jgi:hypothetical protein
MAKRDLIDRITNPRTPEELRMRQRIVPNIGAGIPAQPQKCARAAHGCKNTVPSGVTFCDSCSAMMADRA